MLGVLAPSTGTTIGKLDRGTTWEISPRLDSWETLFEVSRSRHEENKNYKNPVFDRLYIVSGSFKEHQIREQSRDKARFSTSNLL